MNSKLAIPASFKAFVIRDKDRAVSAAFERWSLDQLDAGEVVLRVSHSSVNYKDALAATGKGRIIRRFPCIGGIDMAGTVVSSADSRFTPGDAVLATSFDIGVAHHGGYAEYARLPASWVIPLPAGLDAGSAMALGTAGFTAALAITRMEQNGLRPGNGPVLVTGATGGVGSLATVMLAQLGYRVTALTGKAAERPYLESLGASEILLRQELDLERIKPLDAARWAGAIDNLGGPVLAWAASTMRQAGTIASVGLAASHELHTTVMPFILRGASLLGVDSGYIGEPLRSGLWRRLAGDLKPRGLASMTRTIGFDSLPAIFGEFIDGQVRGRTVVRIAAD
ncbi:MAG TPA: oxidoreductase [Rhodocyclaceae bacterium]